MKTNLTIREKVRIQAILLLLGAAVMSIGSFISEPLQPHWLFWVGLILFVSSPVYRVLAIKCPHCGSSMLNCRRIPKHCPDCGKELE